MNECKKCNKKIPYHEDKVFIHIQIAPKVVLDYFFHIECFAKLLKSRTNFYNELKRNEAFRKVFESKEKVKFTRYFPHEL